MKLRSSFAMLRAGDVRAKLALHRDVQPFLRLQFLGAAIDLGLLPALRPGRSHAELCEELEIGDPEGFEDFLELGRSLGLLSRRSDVYALGDRTARMLAKPGNDPVAASVLELVDYHAECYRDLADHLRTGGEGDYLDLRAELIARSSRIVEPVLGQYVRETVRPGRAPRILEIGCGSGIYLLEAARANRHARGIGIEAREEVAEGATALLAREGAADRFSILCGEIPGSFKDAGGPFDIVTLYNNVYYFSRGDRRSLFGQIRSHLLPHGRFHLASMLYGKTPTSRNMSLVLELTRGCHRLPTGGELIADLTATGFADVCEEKLLLNEPFVAFAAS